MNIWLMHLLLSFLISGILHAAESEGGVLKFNDEMQQDEKIVVRQEGGLKLSIPKNTEQHRVIQNKDIF